MGAWARMIEITKSSEIQEEAIAAADERLVCKECRAEYREKHWYSAAKKLDKKRKAIEESICPGCYRVAMKISNGVVTIEGPSVRTQHDQIFKLIERVASECWADNPTSRIFDVTESEDKIELQTTTEWCATRIGKALRKTYKGLLEIKGSPQTRFVEVHWFFNR
jgi:coenzyme F420-reducing hydrogenase gamma subunit